MVSPAWHETEHLPAEQTSPDGQAWPHEPQSLALVWISVQAPLQIESPAWQVSPHFPPEQTCPAAHALPQPPQLALSFATSTQLPLQLTDFPEQLEDAESIPASG